MAIQDKINEMIRSQQRKDQGLPNIFSTLLLRDKSNLELIGQKGVQKLIKQMLKFYKALTHADVLHDDDPKKEEIIKFYKLVVSLEEYIKEFSEREWEVEWKNFILHDEFLELQKNFIALQSRYHTTEERLKTLSTMSEKEVEELKAQVEHFSVIIEDYKGFFNTVHGLNENVTSKELKNIYILTYPFKKSDIHMEEFVPQRIKEREKSLLHLHSVKKTRREIDNTILDAFSDVVEQTLLRKDVELLRKYFHSKKDLTDVDEGAIFLAGARKRIVGKMNEEELSKMFHTIYKKTSSKNIEGIYSSFPVKLKTMIKEIHQMLPLMNKFDFQGNLEMFKSMIDYLQFSKGQARMNEIASHTTYLTHHELDIPYQEIFAVIDPKSIDNKDERASKARAIGVFFSLLKNFIFVEPSFLEEIDIDLLKSFYFGCLIEMKDRGFLSYFLLKTAKLDKFIECCPDLVVNGISLDFRHEESFLPALYDAVMNKTDSLSMIKKELKSIVKAMDLKDLLTSKDMNQITQSIVERLESVFSVSESSIPKHISLQAGWYYRKDIMPILEEDKGVFNARIKLIENTNILGSLSLERALILFKDTEQQNLDILSPELISAIQHVKEGEVLIEYSRRQYGEDGIRPVGIVLGYN
ncbi:MAG: hypothetical protein ACK4NC_06825 [Candidatus Gracilibacteria bacterium]